MHKNVMKKPSRKSNQKRLKNIPRMGSKMYPKPAENGQGSQVRGAFWPPWRPLGAQMHPGGRRGPKREALGTPSPPPGLPRMTLQGPPWLQKAAPSKRRATTTTTKIATNINKNNKNNSKHNKRNSSNTSSPQQQQQQQQQQQPTQEQL